MDAFEEQSCDQSETEAENSDDSDDDPSFDVLEETQLSLSNLSIKRKRRIRIVSGADEKEEQDSASIETVVPDLDKQSQKTYESVQKIIEDGQMERLKVEQCKIYLRKHGLRLSGTKEILIQRIKEHINIVSGGGEKKYPTYSFVMNCRGDACMGDVVMFEQEVYEGFNIASRSASGPPCGRRVVAGRIVKESYGAAKQQHTFTIEVLWSKGEKPLPPLHQLLIKGRNLYRLKTRRQRWDDEERRQKILSEKHDRGGAARLDRETRIQQREMRKMQQHARATRIGHRNTKQEKRDKMSSIPVAPDKLRELVKLQQEDRRNAQKLQNYDQGTCSYSSSSNNNPTQPQYFQAKPYSILKPQILPPEDLPQRQSVIGINHHFHRDQRASSQFNNFASSMNTNPGGFIGHHISGQLHGIPYDGHLDYSQHHRDAFYRKNSNAARSLPVQQQGSKQKQTCWHYIQGRCYYGERCKFVHDLGGNGL